MLISFFFDRLLKKRLDKKRENPILEVISGFFAYFPGASQIFAFEHRLTTPEDCISLEHLVREVYQSLYSALSMKMYSCIVLDSGTP